MELQHCWQLKAAALPLPHPVPSQSMPETPLMLKVQCVGFSANQLNSPCLSKNTKGPPEQCMVCQDRQWRRICSLSIVIKGLFIYSSRTMSSHILWAFQRCSIKESERVQVLTGLSRIQTCPPLKICCTL